MQNRKVGGALLAAFALALIVAGRGAARAQDGDDPRPQGPSRAEVNHEVHLHLLVTAEGAEGASRAPQSLDGVVRQLKAALPPSDYRLAATFINRVRDGGMLDVKSAGGGPFGLPQALNTLTPSFFQLSLANVRLVEAGAGQPSININQFRLGMKVPIQTASVSGDKGSGYPVIQYEDTGITTQLSVREGEPTLVGTLNTSRPGQLFVIVVTVRRTGR